MTARLSRRHLLATGAAGLLAPALPALALAETYAPSAASLARPAAPERDASGLLVYDRERAEVPLARYAGQTLLVSLWAPWCLPCRREMPSLARLAARLDGGPVTVLPLAFDWRGASGVARFYREIGVDNLPILLGDGENLLATLGIELLPTTIVLDGAARHIATVAGEAQWDDDPTEAWLRGLAG